MGYTHYWYREKEIDKKAFEEIVQDFKNMTMLLHAYNIKLAGGLGEDEPTIDNDAVIFNGVRKCGHKQINNAGIVWPSEHAHGTSNQLIADGSWFAGITINARSCDGDCSHETFYFPRMLENEQPIAKISYTDMNGQPVYNEPWRVGRYFQFCKTAFKPYDLAVNIFLVIAKHYLGDKIIVKSDGELAQWQDAIALCQRFLNYGDNFKLGI